MTNGLGVRFFIAGGAGFIGSHFLDALLASKRTQRVTIYDNFSSGRAWHLEHHRHDERLIVVCADIHDTDALRAAMAGHDGNAARRPVKRHRLRPILERFR